jgi:hypothetical protein
MGGSNDQDGVYNVYSRVCHRLSCHTIRGANGRYYAPVVSWKNAIELGLKPCVNCRPFFLPMARPPAVVGKSAVSEPSLDEQIAANERRIKELEQLIADTQSRPAVPARTATDATAQAEAPHSPNQQVIPEPAADVTKWRRSIEQALKRLDQTGGGPSNESLGARIGRVSREGAIPRSVAAMMRTIAEMRNTVEHEYKTLSYKENVAAWASWQAIQEWANQEGLQL